LVRKEAVCVSPFACDPQQEGGECPLLITGKSYLVFVPCVCEGMISI